MAPKEAIWYRKESGNTVICQLCPHNCNIKTGDKGICSARINYEGRLISDIYGQVSSMAMDPIEKKPLYHYRPGSAILSIGTKGCNLRCPYCQNWQISQNNSARTSYYRPEKITEIAIAKGSVGIAYTYSEPIVWYEFIKDTACISREKGLSNVMVTNGFINPDPLADLLPIIDAMNIDLKSFRSDTYRRVLKGSLEEIKAAITYAYKAGCHIEITTLIVTGFNDSLEEMMDCAGFIASIDSRIPWHISRYYPNYKYNEKATDTAFIEQVYNESSKILRYVYTGNLPSGSIGCDTKCHSCGTIIVERTGYKSRIMALEESRCAKCGADIYIVG
jgi:pyruvate formate lyase activating enzyme